MTRVTTTNQQRPVRRLSGSLSLTALATAMALGGYAGAAGASDAPPTSAAAEGDAPASSAPTGSAAGGGPVELEPDPSLFEPASCDLSGFRHGIASPVRIEILDEFWDQMTETAEHDGNGIEVSVVDAEGDDARQIEIGELFVSQGFDAIHVNASSPAGWEGVIADANEQGIGVFNHSPEIFPGATQNVLIDHYGAGYGNGVAAAEWINENFGGEAEIGIVGIIDVPALAMRTDGFVDAIEEFAPNATIHPAANPPLNDVEAAAAAVANLTQEHPDIRVVFVYNDDAALAAVTALAEAGKTSPDEYFVTGVDGIPSVLEEIASGESPLQATGAFLFDYSAVQVERDTEKFLCGQDVPPTRVLGVVTATPENAAELLEVSTDPLNPENAELFGELMHYFDVELNEGDEVPQVAR
jgi:ribose transport system substrate-binding protein